MPAKLIASYRRELSALADLQDAGTVTYTLLREADAYCIRAQRDTAPAVECMVCDTGEERVGMLTRFLYENAVEPAQAHTIEPKISRITANDVHWLESAVAKPVVVTTDTNWNIA